MTTPSPFLGSTSGLSRQRLRGRSYDRMSRDVYVLRDSELDLRARTKGVVLVLADAVPCLFTAALLQRLPVDDDGLVHVARGAKAPRTRRPGVRVHRTPVAADERLDLDGLEVADGPRTFVDLAARLDLEQLVAVGDVVLRRYDAEALRAAVDRRPKRPGLPRARHALPLLDAGADSPAETRARLRLHAAGFASLRHGVTVCDAHGGWVAAPDLADERAKVAVQHDGLVHFSKDLQHRHRDVRQRQQDVQRDELTRQADWQVVVATALDDRRPHLLVDKVTDAYRRAARLLGPQVLPPHLR
jgi:hypothetical protein